MTMFKTKAMKVGVVGIAAAMAASVATTTLAQGNPQGAQQARHAVEPYSEQMLDRMATTLNLNENTRTEASELFEDARETRYDIVENMRALQVPLAGLNPADDDYVDQVEDLAEKRGELMVKLDINNAETRHKFYELLSDEQIQKLESLGGH